MEPEGFITAFTRTRYLFLSWARSIQAILLLHFLKIHFNIILPFTLGLLKCSLFLRSVHQNPVRTSPVSHKCHMPCPSHSSWFGHPSNTWWRLEFKKFPIMQSSTRPFYLVPVATKRLHPHPLLEHSQPTFLPQYERPSSPPTQKNRRNIKKIILMYKSLFIFLDGKLDVETIL